MRQQLKARVFLAFVAVAMSAALAGELRAQAPIVDVGKALAGFDDYMAKVLTDWNGPGIWRRDHRRRHAGLREGLCLSRLREEAAVHAGNGVSHRVEYEAVHRGRRRHAR